MCGPEQPSQPLPGSFWYMRLPGVSIPHPPPGDASSSVSSGETLQLRTAANSPISVQKAFGPLPSGLAAELLPLACELRMVSPCWRRGRGRADRVTSGTGLQRAGGSGLFSTSQGPQLALRKGPHDRSKSPVRSRPGTKCSSAQFTGGTTPAPVQSWGSKVPRRF